jgi:hypothetical protein
MIRKLTPRILRKARMGTYHEELHLDNPVLTDF